MTKTSLVQKLNTSLPQLDRILDPENTLITLDVLSTEAQIFRYFVGAGNVFSCPP